MDFFYPMEYFPHDLAAFKYLVVKTNSFHLIDFIYLKKNYKTIYFIYLLNSDV